MSGNYDVQQVCENGHQITDCCKVNPEKQKKFCTECGAATLTACPCCAEAMQGAQIKVRQSRVAGRRPERVMRTLETQVFVPSYCPNCGEPFPWTQTKITIAIQILAEFGNLDEEEKKTIKEDIENIAKDVPAAELSAMRLKRIWEKCGRAGYEVIMEFASRTAANILKGP